MPPRQPGERGAHGVGRELDADQGDAEGLGDVLVLADGEPAAAEAGVLHAPGDDAGGHGEGGGEIEELGGRAEHESEQDRLGNVDDALCAAEQGLEHVGEDQDADDLAQAEGGDGEIVAADPEHGKAEQEAGGRRGGDAERQGREEGKRAGAAGAPR